MTETDAWEAPTPEVNKIEAARRQLEQALELLFDGKDPLPIHTLAMAALRILRDLASDRPDEGAKTVALMEASIRPGVKKGEFWGALHQASNFLKHANRDPDAVLNEIRPEANDYALCIAGLIYQDLGGDLSPRMKVLRSLICVRNPDVVMEPFGEVYRNIGDDIRSWSRDTQLAFSRIAICAMEDNHPISKEEMAIFI